jgi:hypothetical protein
MKLLLSSLLLISSSLYSKTLEKNICIVEKNSKKYNINCTIVNSKNICGDYKQVFLKKEFDLKNSIITKTYNYKCIKPLKKLCSFRVKNKDSFKTYYKSCSLKSSACNGYSLKFIENKKIEKNNYIANIESYECIRPTKKICLLNVNDKNYKRDCLKIKKSCGSGTTVFSKNKIVDLPKYKTIFDIDIYSCKLPEYNICRVIKNNKNYQVSCNSTRTNRACKGFVQSFLKKEVKKYSSKILNVFTYTCSKPSSTLCFIKKGKKTYKVACENIQNNSACGTFKQSFVENKQFIQKTHNILAKFYQCTKPTVKVCAIKKGKKVYQQFCSLIDKKSGCGSWTLGKLYLKKTYNKSNKNLDAYFYTCNKPIVPSCIIRYNSKEYIKPCTDISSICVNPKVVETKKIERKNKIYNASYYTCDEIIKQDNSNEQIDESKNQTNTDSNNLNPPSGLN